ncbi:hypothetical protein Hypma_005418 [Hypsizygus marmoreus]|uniref:Uncharacterized protein n=1 Tax=Hypsizygus marmoreus TaxID=39966 RepID=A0A369JZR1_HYPMA|nr:hypothetical protein Hypma_005418 [Hypsizygus marmoreus]
MEMAAAREARHLYFPTPEPHRAPLRATSAPPSPSRERHPPAASLLLDDPMDVEQSDYQDRHDSNEDPFHAWSDRASSAPPDANISTADDLLKDFVSDTARDFHDCPGVSVQWPVETGSFNETFPWARVGEAPQSLPFRVEVHDQGRTVRAWSKECLGVSTSGGLHCHRCSDVPPRVSSLATLAIEARAHTNHRFLNPLQLRGLICDREAEINRLKLYSLNLARKLGNTVRRLADSRRLLMSIAENDIPRIKNILQAGLRSGSSVRRLISKVEDSLEGLYNPRGFGSRAFDMAVMTYRMGGRKLLFSLSRGLGLPSLRTLRNNMIFTRIMPTVGTITSSEIIHNINEVVIKTRKEGGRTEVRGVSILMDEIALEEMAVHFRHSNSVGGLCWKHASLVDVVLHTYDSAVNLAKALVQGKVHIGKEMTVVAASCFGEPGVYPILAAPTCKQENAADMEYIFDIISRNWKEHGESVGKIWSFATDGDATRRAAGYTTFLNTPLSAMSALYGILSNMSGLNLFTGLNEVTLDFDYKHIFKRVCTLLRSDAGVVVNNGRQLNPMFLRRYLLLVDGQDEASVRKLLYPADPQDVPCAIDLMQAIIAAGRLGLEATDINVIADLDAIKLLGELLEAILEPFINPSLSVTEQVTSLSKYAHMAMTLFTEHRLKFMSNQLYGDSQTMVKNVMFCIAKQQKLDADKPFYLFDVGDDKLEKLFGRIRMLGGHDSGMNYRQGVDRLGHAVDIDGAYMRNPDLDPGHRRLDMSRTESSDHFNVRNWHGNAIVGHCDLPSAWAAGASMAILVLNASQMRKCLFDFPLIFAQPGVDLLRPFGQNRYPGVEGDPDRSLAMPPSDAAITSVVDETGEAPETLSAEEADDLTFEEVLDDIPELELPSGPGVDPSDYLDVEGKWVHKQSICRLVINRFFEPKSHSRLLRVRTFTRVNGPKVDLNSDDLVDADTFILGDPVLTLLRTGNTLSLALLRTTTINEDGVSRSSIKLATLRNPQSKVKLHGQILRMQSTPTSENISTPPISPLLIREENASTPWTLWCWLWTGGYVTVDCAMKGMATVTQKPVIVQVPGHLVEVVNPCIVSTEGRLTEDQAREVNSEGKTWELEGTQMSTICDLLWHKIVDSKTAPSAITSFKPNLSGGFPYAFIDGSPSFVCESGSLQLSAVNDPTAVRNCHFCGHGAPNYRAHIGLHILQSIRGVTPRSVLSQPVGRSMPCGFCGLSGKSECAVYLKKANVESNCAFSHAFRYGFADKGSAATPCRNVPVVCGLCPGPSAHPRGSAEPGIWRYNMGEHFALRHSEYASPANPEGLPLPYSVWKSMELFPSEEAALGIPSNHIPTPFVNFESHPSDLAQEATGGSRGRKRASSSSGPSAKRSQPARAVARGGGSSTSTRRRGARS